MASAPVSVDAEPKPSRIPLEDVVLPGAGDQTLGQLRAALRRAVIAVDPKGAERRRQEAERRARIRLYADEEGTASLCGQNLPGAQSAALPPERKLSHIGRPRKRRRTSIACAATPPASKRRPNRIHAVGVIT